MQGMQVQSKGGLGREPKEGVRIVALELMEEARVASVRLGDPEDLEALHDFRVALRRLRSWLRSFRPQLDDTVRGRYRRQLREVVAATGEARDLEVMRALVQEEAKGLPPRHRRAAEWLLARVAPVGGEKDPRVLAVAGLERLAPHLLEALQGYRREVGAGRAGRFGDVAAVAIFGQHAALLAALSEVQGPDDAARAHRARIEGKRLRYLLEPLREAVPEAAEAVRTMKALQDGLGELHDLHLLAGRLQDGMVSAAAEGAREMHQALHAEGEERAREVARQSLRPGLLALDLRVRTRRDALHASLREDWLQGGFGLRKLGREVEAVLSALRQERKGSLGGKRSSGGAGEAGRAGGEKKSLRLRAPGAGRH
jgi:CHAD domain-containing protein